jgi:hypothetical protein
MSHSLFDRWAWSKEKAKSNASDQCCCAFDISPERQVSVAVAAASRQTNLFARLQIQKVDYGLFRLGVKSTSRSRRALSWLNYVICTRWGFYWK